MTDIQSYILYTLFLIFVVYFSQKNVILLRNNTSTYGYIYDSKNTFIFIFIYSFIVGLRYNVGSDYFGYSEWYKELQETGVFPVDNDLGFILMNKILVGFGFESYALFILISFLQITFIVLFIRKYNFLTGWYFYFFFTNLIFFVSLNAMRQTISFFIFSYCLNLYYDKKIISAILFSIVAIMIHKTVLILFVLLPLLRFEWVKNVKYQLIVFSLATFVPSNYFQVLLNYFSPIINYLGYSYYLENIDFIKQITMENKRGDNLSYILFFFVDITLILFYNDLKKVFSNYNYIKFYNIYFTGVVLSKTFTGNFIFSRIVDYFIFYRIVVLSFFMFYVFSVSNKNINNKFIKPLSILICIAFFLYFLKAIYNNAAYIVPIKFIFNK